MSSENKLGLLGKKCCDIISDYEGICIGMVEFLFGREQYIIKPKSDTNGKVSHVPLYKDQLEIIDDGICEKVKMPKYEEPEYFGKVCFDKVTGISGVCVARLTSVFNYSKYMLEFQPDDLSKDIRIIWLDERRVQVIDGDIREIKPKSV